MGLRAKELCRKRNIWFLVPISSYTHLASFSFYKKVYLGPGTPCPLAEGGLAMNMGDVGSVGTETHRACGWPVNLDLHYLSFNDLCLLPGTDNRAWVRLARHRFPEQDFGQAEWISHRILT